MLTSFTAVCPNLRVYAQEDAHEYLLGLLSRMEESVVSGVGKVPRSTLDTNVIRRIFGGVTRSEGRLTLLSMPQSLLLALWN